MRSELKKELARVKPALKINGIPVDGSNQDEVGLKLKKDIGSMRSELGDLIKAIKLEADESKQEAQKYKKQAEQS